MARMGDSQATLRSPRSDFDAKDASLAAFGSPMSLSMEEGENMRVALEEALEEAAVLREEVKCLEHQLFEQKNKASDSRSAIARAAREEATRQCAATHATHVEELEQAHRQCMAVLQDQLNTALPLVEECKRLRGKVLSLEGTVTELATTAEAHKTLERDFDAVNARMQLNMVQHATELGNCKTMWYKTEMDRSKLEKECACLKARLACVMTTQPAFDTALQERVLNGKVQARETQCVHVKALDGKAQSLSSSEKIQAARVAKQVLDAQANAHTDAEKLRTAYEAYERVDQQCSNLKLEVQAKSGALVAALQESAMLRDKLAERTQGAGLSTAAHAKGQAEPVLGNTWNIDQERTKLAAERRQLEVERCQLEVERCQLEVERCQLESEQRQLEAEKKALSQQYKPVHITVVVREHHAGDVCAARDQPITSMTMLSPLLQPASSTNFFTSSDPASEEASKGYEGRMLESILNTGSWGSWPLW